jgi:hypothetical protein
MQQRVVFISQVFGLSPISKDSSLADKQAPEFAIITC